MNTEPFLDIQSLHAGYDKITVLDDVHLRVGREPMALIGRNGMGKSTLCKVIMGMLPAKQGKISFEGRQISGLTSDNIARLGIGYVPQGRRLFPSLTVEEHLRLAERGRDAPWTVARVFELFPRLAERRRNGGAELSGGEAQMLAIGRALMTCPKFIVLDEPTEGLAPVIVDRVVEVLQSLSREGIGLLLVEQNIRVATDVAHEVAIMVNGHIVTVEPAERMAKDEALQRQYLGVAGTASA